MSLTDFGFEYDAYGLDNNLYFSDASFDENGRRWHTDSLSFDALGPGGNDDLDTPVSLGFLVRPEALTMGIAHRTPGSRRVSWPSRSRLNHALARRHVLIKATQPGLPPPRVDRARAEPTLTL